MFNVHTLNRRNLGRGLRSRHAFASHVPHSRECPPGGEDRAGMFAKLARVGRAGAASQLRCLLGSPPRLSGRPRPGPGTRWSPRRPTPARPRPGPGRRWSPRPGLASAFPSGSPRWSGGTGDDLGLDLGQAVIGVLGEPGQVTDLLRELATSRPPGSASACRQVSASWPSAPLQPVSSRASAPWPVR